MGTRFGQNSRLIKWSLSCWDWRSGKSVCIWQSEIISYFTPSILSSGWSRLQSNCSRRQASQTNQIKNDSLLSLPCPCSSKPKTLKPIMRSESLFRFLFDFTPFGYEMSHEVCVSRKSQSLRLTWPNKISFTHFLWMVLSPTRANIKQERERNSEEERYNRLSVKSGIICAFYSIVFIKEESLVMKNLIKTGNKIII